MIIKPERRIFIHIPKTGGTSITQRYVEKYKINAKLGVSNHPFILYDDTTRVAKTEWHFTYDRAYMQFPNYEYFTVIRNPVDRWISTYKHFYMRDFMQEGIEEWTEKVIRTLPVFDFFDASHEQYKTAIGAYSIHYKFFWPQWMYYREPEVKVHTIDTIWEALDLKPQHKKKGINIPKFHRNIIKEMIYNYYRKDFERWQTIE